MKKTTVVLSLVLSLQTSASAGFVEDFNSQAKTYFNSAIVKSMKASADGTGTVVFKPNTDYFGTGDKVNKIMAVESARLFRAVPQLNKLSLTLPLLSKNYQLNITRKEIESHYGLKLGGMSLDQWGAKFTSKFDNKTARAEFVRKFVTVKADPAAFASDTPTSGTAAATFRSCAAARAAGYSNMRRGQPGYSSNLDRDNDGIACDK